MFEFLKKEGGTDEHATNPGAATSAPSSAPGSSPPDGSTAGTLAAAQSVAAGAEAKQLLEASPRRRGRPPKNAAAGGGNSGAVPSAELQAELDKAVDAIYAPEAWGATLAMPGDAMAAITGRERWELSKEERKTLGVTGSAVARSMMITNPKGLAIFMLASALFSAYVPRAVEDLRELAAKRRAEKQKPLQSPQ